MSQGKQAILYPPDPKDTPDQVTHEATEGAGEANTRDGTSSSSGSGGSKANGSMPVGIPSTAAQPREKEEKQDDPANNAATRAGVSSATEPGPPKAPNSLPVGLSQDSGKGGRQ